MENKNEAIKFVGNKEETINDLEKQIHETKIGRKEIIKLKKELDDVISQLEGYLGGLKYQLNFEKGMKDANSK